MNPSNDAGVSKSTNSNLECKANVNMMRNVIVCTVGGNIGCGKSTILKKLADGTVNLETPLVRVFMEPLDKWGDWLRLFYKDAHKHAFGFQMKVLVEFAYRFSAGEDGGVRNIINVTERCPMDSLYVFAHALQNSGYMNANEYELFEQCVCTFGWKPTHYVYVRTTPEEAYRRLQKRNRGCESGIELQYLRDVHDAYEKYVYETLPVKYPDIRVHVIEATHLDETCVYAETLKILNTEHTC